MTSISVFAYQLYPSTADEIAQDAANGDRLFKATSNQRFTETLGIKIQAIFADTDVILTLIRR